MKKSLKLRKCLLIASMLVPMALIGGMKEHAMGIHEEKAKELRLIDTNDLFGTDVYGSNGEKLGDIVDIAVNFDNQRVTHALIMTGGILNLSGDVRAVPAEALKAKDGRYHLNLDTNSYMSIDLLPNDNVVAALNNEYGTKLMKQFAQKHGKAYKSKHHVKNHGPSALFSEVDEYNITFSDSNEDDFWVTGALVDLDKCTIAYIELDGTGFTTMAELHDYHLRVMVPTTEIASVDNGSIRFAITLEEARDADRVQDVDAIETKSSERGKVYTLSMN